MPGLSGQSRDPRAKVRTRRNFDGLANYASFIGPGEVVALTSTGYFAVTLASAGGLQNASGTLSLKLDSSPGLTLGAGGVKILLASTPGLSLTSGLGILLDTNPGLALAAGGLKVSLGAVPGLDLTSGLSFKAKASGGILVDSGGAYVDAATTSMVAGVLKQVNVADLTSLTDSSGGTSGSGTVGAIGIAITDPADTPADADTLRDDLVLNTIPSIETELSNLRNAVATLSAYCNTLEGKINAMLAAQRTAGQM